MIPIGQNQDKFKWVMQKSAQKKAEIAAAIRMRRFPEDLRAQCQSENVQNLFSEFNRLARFPIMNCF